MFKIKTGSLCGKLKKSLVDLSGNFMLDLDKKNNYESVEMKIDTISKPYWIIWWVFIFLILKYFYLNTRNLNSNPAKIDDVIKVFETMDAEINKHNDNKIYGLKVPGVQIRFVLSPIKLLIGVNW